MAVEIKEGKYEYDTETGKLAPTYEELVHWFLWVNEHASEFIGFNLLGRFSIFGRLMFCFNDREGMLYVSRIEGEHES